MNRFEVDTSIGAAALNLWFTGFAFAHVHDIDRARFAETVQRTDADHLESRHIILMVIMPSTTVQKSVSLSCSV